jgi:hypothetical protein
MRYQHAHQYYERITGQPGSMAGIWRIRYINTECGFEQHIEETLTIYPDKTARSESRIRYFGKVNEWEAIFPSLQILTIADTLLFDNGWAQSLNTGPYKFTDDDAYATAIGYRAYSYKKDSLFIAEDGILLKPIDNHTMVADSLGFTGGMGSRYDWCPLQLRSFYWWEEWTRLLDKELAFFIDQLIH